MHARGGFQDAPLAVEKVGDDLDEQIAGRNEDDEGHTDGMPASSGRDAESRC